MADIPSMDPCPVSKRGRHSLASIVPTEDAETMLASRLDDATADELAALVRPW